MSIIFILCSVQVTAAVKKVNTATSDFGVVNKAQILYWLEKRGELEKNASDEQKQKAFKKYLGNKSFKPRKLPGKFGEKIVAAEKAAIASVNNKGNQKALRSSTQKSAQQATSQVKVLAILIDFPDLKHDNNGLTSSDTSMYYSDYTAQHYSGLLFSNSGYVGPSGQNLESAYQYYQQESGQGLAFTGNVKGWFTADKNAAFYGGNDPDNNDSDKNADALVLEAVTKAVAAGLDLSEYDQSDFFDLDGDGNINEPDGIIDHVMVFHSSMGEETGGGTLAEDAIWSHRGSVVGGDNLPASVPGSAIKLYGYTITPIDAAVGVVVHEFGHDLGIPDEYDTDNGTFGSPVANWSLMASGSWLGSPSGTKPSGFSPYVKDIYQNKYQGNWINQRTLELSNLTTSNINMVTATNHNNGINQVKINLPVPQLNFGAPYTGDYQFYSNAGDMFTHTLSFNTSLPAGTSTLTMKARWDIELDYDYVQILVNDTPVEGNHTKVTNQFYSGITHFITDKSLSITGAEGDLGWVDLTFDLSAYENQAVTIKIIYVTDQAVGGYGFVADDIKVSNNGSDVVFIGGETDNEVTLDGFSRIAATIDGAPQNYYLQLRSYTETDSALTGPKYELGLLVWYRNDGVSDNQVNTHPGKVFIGVVDADQNPIKRGNSFANTDQQIRDAAFSLFDQGTSSGDTHLTATSIFDDRVDYSSAFQPESGIILPQLGLSIEVSDQASDSRTASVILTKSDLSLINSTHNGLTVSFSVEDINMSTDSTFVWQMGDGTRLTEANVTHTYTQAGSYTVSVTYQTNTGDKTLTAELVVGEAIVGDLSTEKAGTNITVSANLTGGEGNFIYRWDFGDGSDVVQGTNASVSHVYDQVGEFTITLSVLDDTLQSYTFTTTVSIENNLTATFTITTNNLAVDYTAISSGGDGNYTYLWNFGDGTSSTEMNPSHTYSSAGSYSVTLTVTDGNGLTAETTTTVTVSAPVVQPTPTQTSNSSSGGGSFNFGLLLLLVIFMSRKILKVSKE